jgi:hypothetical protein
MSDQLYPCRVCSSKAHVLLKFHPCCYPSSESGHGKLHHSRDSLVAEFPDFLSPRKKQSHASVFASYRQDCLVREFLIIPQPAFSVYNCRIHIDSNYRMSSMKTAPSQNVSGQELESLIWSSFHCIVHHSDWFKV